MKAKIFSLFATKIIHIFTKNQTKKLENPMQRNNRAKALEAGKDEK